MCNICLLSPGSPNSERRCISEAFPDEVTIPMDTIGNNVTDNPNNNVRSSSANVNNTKTSHHSLRMIDHITKELVQFSQTSLNVDDSQAATSRNEQVPTLVTWDLSNMLPMDAKSIANLANFVDSQTPRNERATLAIYMLPQQLDILVTYRYQF